MGFFFFCIFNILWQLLSFHHLLPEPCCPYYLLAISSVLTWHLQLYKDTPGNCPSTVKVHDSLKNGYFKKSFQKDPILNSSLSHFPKFFWKLFSFFCKECRKLKFGFIKCCYRCKLLQVWNLLFMPICNLKEKSRKGKKKEATENMLFIHFSSAS
jgi:hypothetical protein